jgi:outer membrane protein assembly factor BamE (lipoprotein component of BamABCDE complex)
VSNGSVTRRGALALALSGVAALALSGCAAVYENHGYIPSEVELAGVEVGKSTQGDVTTAIGRPASTGVLEGSAWYYVGSRWKHFGARAPKEIDRQVLVISFTSAGVVENIERFGLEKGQIVVLSRRVTDSGIKGIGVLRQLFGNLGRLDAGQVLQ